MKERLDQALASLATNPAETLRLAEEVIAEASSDPREAREHLTEAHRVRGQALRAFSRHAEAVEAFAAAAAVARSLGDTRMAALVRVGSVDSLGMLGRFDEAIQLAHTLERDLRANGDDIAAAKALFNLGAIHYRRDQYAPALECFERAAGIFAEAPDAAVLLAHVQTNTALALTFLDRTDEALILYSQAHQTFLDNDMPVLAATVAGNIGFLHYVSGRYVNALAALNEARSAFHEQGRLHEAARYDIDAGDAYRVLNLVPEARECYGRALDIFAQQPLDYDEARARLGHAATSAEEGATAHWNRAEAIFRRQNIAPQRAHLRLLRAAEAQRQGQGAEAERLAETAARLFARSGLRGWAAEAAFVACEVALISGAKPTRRLHRIRRIAQESGRGWLGCRAHNALGRLYAANGDTERALQQLRAGVEALEAVRTPLGQEEIHTAFLSDKLRIYEDLIALLLARGTQKDVAEALEQVERAKSRLLLERVLSALPADQTPLPERIQAKIADLRAQISRAYHQEIALGDNEARRLAVADAPRLTMLENAYGALLRDTEISFGAPHGGTGALSSMVTADEICRSIEPDTCLLEYYFVHGRLFAFLLTNDGIRCLELEYTPDDLENDLRRLRFHLQSAGEDREEADTQRRVPGMRRVLAQLYDRLLRPLHEWGVRDKKRIVFIPHGLLHRVPFHALHDGAGYALDRWEIMSAPSASLWYALKSRPDAARPESALLMGVPEPGIEYVADEIAQLAHQMPGASVFCGESATLATFRACAPGMRCLHLAMHGLFRADNPLFSGLRFADGWLLARDLYEMQLNADLVTLSACRTGLTSVAPSDELFGLVRGFLAAGARGMMVSLWPADDAATSLLMIAFYAALQSGQNPGAALRQAQVAVRASFPHPYHWAAFRLIGGR